MCCAALTKQHLDSSCLKVLAKQNQAANKILLVGLQEVFNFFSSFNIIKCCRFQKDLKEIGHQIDRKNRRRTPKYEYLNPKFVPNAISI